MKINLTKLLVKRHNPPKKDGADAAWISPRDATVWLEDSPYSFSLEEVEEGT